MEKVSILFVGNSFARDTAEHLANVALAAGVKDVFFGTLFVGGCSIRKHFANAQEDTGNYIYYTNDGAGWQDAHDVKISDAVKSRQWDWISIQHGTGDGSRYTVPESYEKLPELVAYLRDLAPNAKIAFNMAWVMDSDGTHPEIVSYGGDQLKMYGCLTELTRTVVAPQVDRVSPAGTAIQNARGALDKPLTRDKFHLSYGLGRFIASLTFFHALTDVAIDGVDWMPAGVEPQEREIAIAAAKAAVKAPYSVTKL